MCLGQTGRTVKQRFKEHLPSNLELNSNKLAKIEHLVGCNLSYNSIEHNKTILHKLNKYHKRKLHLKELQG